MNIFQSTDLPKAQVGILYSEIATFLPMKELLRKLEFIYVTKVPTHETLLIVIN